MTIYIIDANEAVDIDPSAATASVQIANASTDQLVVRIAGGDAVGSRLALPRDGAISLPVGETDGVRFPAGISVTGSSGQSFDVTIT